MSVISSSHCWLMVQVEVLALALGCGFNGCHRKDIPANMAPSVPESLQNQLIRVMPQCQRTFFGPRPAMLIRGRNAIRRAAPGSPFAWLNFSEKGHHTEGCQHVTWSLLIPCGCAENLALVPEIFVGSIAEVKNCR